MTTHHPDLVAEQAYLDHAYACLERARQDAFRLRALTEVGRGGTHQARYERYVVEEAIGSLLSLDQSLLVIWPQFIAIIAATMVTFGIAYVAFMRQEVRA